MLQGMQGNASQNTCFLCGIQVRRLAAGWGEMHVKNGSVEPVRPCCFPVFSWFRRNVWHPGWGKRGPKMVSLNRPGHAVAPFGGRLFGARPEWFWCDIVAKAKSELHCYSLASGWGDMYVKNGSVELARPCCFLVWRGAFCTENRLGEPVRPCCFPVASKSWFRVRVVGKLQGNLQNRAKIVYSFLVNPGAPFWHRESPQHRSKNESLSSPGHAVSLSRRERFWGGFSVRSRGAPQSQV